MLDETCDVSIEKKLGNTVQCCISQTTTYMYQSVIASGRNFTKRGRPKD